MDIPSISIIESEKLFVRFTLHTGRYLVDLFKKVADLGADDRTKNTILEWAIKDYPGHESWNYIRLTPEEIAKVGKGEGLRWERQQQFVLPWWAIEQVQISTSDPHTEPNRRHWAVWWNCPVPVVMFSPTALAAFQKGA